MPLTLNSLHHSIVLDPNNHYTSHLNAQQLIDTGGFLVDWAIAYFEKGKKADTLREHMEKCYTLPLDPFPPESKVEDNLVLTYPGDPDLYPTLIIQEHNPEEVEVPGAPLTRIIIYQYGIVVIEENGNQFITRMS